MRHVYADQMIQEIAESLAICDAEGLAEVYSLVMNKKVSVSENYEGDGFFWIEDKE